MLPLVKNCRETDILYYKPQCFGNQWCTLSSDVYRKFITLYKSFKYYVADMNCAIAQNFWLLYLKTR